MGGPYTRTVIELGFVIFEGDDGTLLHVQKVDGEYVSEPREMTESERRRVLGFGVQQVSRLEAAMRETRVVDVPVVSRQQRRWLTRNKRRHK